MKYKNWHELMTVEKQQTEQQQTNEIEFWKYNASSGI